MSWLYQQTRPLDQNINFIFRSETKKATESETNVIDRAVANLIFNKSDFNKRDLSMAAPSNSKEEVGGATESSDNQLCQPQIRYLDDHQVVLDDAQVPNLGHTNPYPAANLTKSFSKKGCREQDFNVGLWFSDWIMDLQQAIVLAIWFGSFEKLLPTAFKHFFFFFFFVCK